MPKWMEWKGGENPAPGMIVEIKTYDGRYVERPSERVVWGLADIGGRLVPPVSAYRISNVSYERYTALTARIKRLEEALRPFCHVENNMDSETPDEAEIELYESITAGDLRRARAAYKGEPDA